MSKIKTQMVIEGENKADPAFKKADNQLLNLTKSAKRAGAALTAVFGAGAAATELARRSAEAVSSMSRLADLSGAGVEQFQKWTFAARTLGFEQEKIADIFKDVQDKVGDFLQTGGGPMKDFFEQVAPLVGVTADQFRYLSGPDALQLYVSSLEKANLSQSDMTFYMEAIANDATLLAPLLANNGEKFAELAKRAEEFGFIVGGDTARDARQFTENMDTLGLVTEGVGKRLTAEMLPAMNTTIGLLLDFAKDSTAVTMVVNVLSFAMKSLATAGIAVGSTFGSLGRLIGGASAAAVAAARGDFSEAAAIMREVTADNEAAAKKAEERIKKLWDGSFEAQGNAAARNAQQTRALGKETAEAVVSSNEALAASYKKLVTDAKSALKDLVSEERKAQKEIEDLRADRVKIEQRYAEAIAGFSGNGGEPSYAQAQNLKLDAGKALRRGDTEGARKSAEAALDVLTKLAEAGENTYGFAGFAKELQGIEIAANGIEETNAENKLKALTAQIEDLNKKIESLTKFDLEIVLSEASKQELTRQMVALGEQLGQVLVIQPTVLAPVVTESDSSWRSGGGATGEWSGGATGSYARGGRISGPGSGTSDSIMARLSNGEYVIKAAAVRKYGANMLDNLNGMRLPKYADGGLVGNFQPPSGGTPVNLHFGDRTFGLNGSSDSVAELAQFFRTQKLKGRK